MGEERIEHLKFQRIQPLHKKIIAKYSPQSDLLRACVFLGKLVTWRDLRKKYNLVANYLILNKYLPELMLRTKLSKFKLWHLYFNEFEALLKTPRNLSGRLARRHSGYFIQYEAGQKYNEYFGSLGRTLRRHVEKRLATMHQGIKGATAYPGNARGCVKIILGVHDFKKMRRGDILVAPNTRPEYVPIMKLAAAILSDEGGVTSHTAIVAREYKIPCVIGCQVATSLLKDDDIVEVDSIKGLIRKI